MSRQLPACRTDVNTHVRLGTVRVHDFHSLRMHRGTGAAARCSMRTLVDDEHKTLEHCSALSLRRGPRRSRVHSGHDQARCHFKLTDSWVHRVVSNSRPMSTTSAHAYDLSRRVHNGHNKRPASAVSQVDSCLYKCIASTFREVSAVSARTWAEACHGHHGATR